MARRCGLNGLGLAPLRRSICVIDYRDQGVVPAKAHRRMPFTFRVVPASDGPFTEDLYFRPEGNRLLISPSDETPSLPCDAQPEDEDIAGSLARFEEISAVPLAGRLINKWAGLRTFAPDRRPVVGRDPRAPGFVWVAGQGGYGIQTAPALARLAAAVALGREVPADIGALGLNAVEIAPDRLLGALPVGA